MYFVFFNFFYIIKVGNGYRLLYSNTESSDNLSIKKEFQFLNFV